MFKKNMKGAVFALIAAATLTGTAAPVFAADPTSFNNSTASTVSGTHNETFTAGSDASQNQVGKETDQVLGGATASNPTETKSQNVSVYATKSSSVQLKVPQVLIGNATKSAYHVVVLNSMPAGRLNHTYLSALFCWHDVFANTCIGSTASPQIIKF